VPGCIQARRLFSAEVVPQASAGALERMDVYACTSMPRTLTQAAEAGWHVIGAGYLLAAI